ncbi:hypothetical protein J2X20_001036 [Pelomonas saccharophila]|uniref:Lumazine-binding protein n=1 Tax=Roseateles saccharophilus TaxID=304 RepID=A0ABU1YHR2_ROSSA|nr:nuclear transport factor 2 family protein [Roseateles saccharophilus]MDR7268407.1 hypothetical protein [Roseateles saccharophilus]
MTQTQAIVALIEDYFHLAYEPESRDFNQVFHPSCLVQWLQDGQLNTLSAPDYAALIHARPSPRSTGAPREEAILCTENISDSLSTATVRVRIGKKLFNDHFVLHRLAGSWLITNKSSFVAHNFD